MNWSRKKLEGVHSSLRNNFKWYNAWHKNPKHQMVHKGLFAIFVITAFVFSLYALNNDLLYRSKAAATYYVSVSGNDANPGTQASPFRTVQKAVNTSIPGDTVVVRAGTYDRFEVTGKNATATSRITVKNYPNEKPVVKTIGLTNSSYVTLSGLEIWEWPNTNMNRSQGVFLVGTNNVIIENCHFRWNVSGGASSGALRMLENENPYTNSNLILRNNEIENRIYVSGDGHQILNNYFHDGKQEDSIRVFGSNILIKGNRFTRWIPQINGGPIAPLPDGTQSHVDVFQFYGRFDGKELSNVVVEQNLIEPSHQGQIFMMEAQKGPVRDITFRNNVVIKNKDTLYPIGLNSKPSTFGYVQAIKVINNTFVSLDGYQAQAARFMGGTGHVFYGNVVYRQKHYEFTEGAVAQKDYNIIYNPGTYFGNPGEAHGLWQVDPKLINVTATGTDLRPQSVSPAVNRGVTGSYTPSTDKNCFTRDATPDIGAYELNSVPSCSGATTPPPATYPDPTPSDTTAPVVNITAPTDRANVSGAVNFTADATDNVGVTKVEFLIDTYLKTTDTSAPYSYSFQTSMLTPGSHILGVKAYDVAGNVTTKTIVVYVVEPQPTDTAGPVLGYVRPTDGSSVSGTSVDNSVSATDPAGVAKVEFYADGALTSTQVTPGTDGNFGYGWDSTMVANGSHILKAVATDKLGNTSQTQVTVNVSNLAPVNTPPVVTVTSPLNGATVSGVLSVAANAIDDSGRIIQVEFTINSSWSYDDAAPYTRSWDTTTVPNGLYTIIVKAADGSWVYGSTTITVNVQNPVDTTSPIVTYVRPGAGATVSGWVDNSVNATDDSGIAKVEFFADGVATFSQTAPGADGNYGYGWDSTKVANGSHVLKARATDNKGNIKEISVNITVNNPTPPNVQVTSPINGATVSGLTTIAANATDDSGRIIQVEFTIDGIWKTYDATAPYTYIWDTRQYANGQHQITVKAADGNWVYGVTQISVNVNNVTTDVTAPVVKITQPAEGAGTSKAIYIEATANDNVGITKVEFYAGNTYLGTDTGAPYSIKWDPRGWSYGSYTLTAKAYDAAGNVGTSSVNVNYAKRWWQFW